MLVLLYIYLLLAEQGEKLKGLFALGMSCVDRNDDISWDAVVSKAKLSKSFLECLILARLPAIITITIIIFDCEWFCVCSIIIVVIIIRCLNIKRDNGKEDRAKPVNLGLILIE